MISHGLKADMLTYLDPNVFDQRDPALIEQVCAIVTQTTVPYHLSLIPT